MEALAKWTFAITLAMFFLTAIAVLVAVGYATVHLAGDIATGEDISNINEKLDTIITEMREENKLLRQELNQETKAIRQEVYTNL